MTRLFLCRFFFVCIIKYFNKINKCLIFGKFYLKSERRVIFVGWRKFGGDNITNESSRESTGHELSFSWSFSRKAFKMKNNFPTIWKCTRMWASLIKSTSAFWWSSFFVFLFVWNKHRRRDCRSKSGAVSVAFQSQQHCLVICDFHQLMTCVSSIMEAD